MGDDFWRAVFDPSAPLPAGWPLGAWGAFLLFLVPIGGGIPAGVLIAHNAGVSAPVTAFLYFLSDIVLAFVYEPMLVILMALGRWIPVLGRIGRALARGVQRTTDRAGAKGPLGLVLVSFSVDPMTGRAAAAAAGHGFLPGWTFAITGDMFYFVLLMASTLWLNGILGDERLTIGVVLVITLLLPSVMRRWRDGPRPAPQTVSPPDRQATPTQAGRRRPRRRD
jgi:hypothetical protein